MKLVARKLVDIAILQYQQHGDILRAVSSAYCHVNMNSPPFVLNRECPNFIRWISPRDAIYTDKEFNGVYATFYGNVVVDEILRAKDKEFVPYHKFLLMLDLIEKDAVDDKNLLELLKMVRNMLYSRLPFDIRDTIVKRVNTRILADVQFILDQGNVLLAVNTDVIHYTADEPLEVNASTQRDEAHSAIAVINNTIFCCQGKYAAMGVRYAKNLPKRTDLTRRDAYKMIEAERAKLKA
ncbi:MAG: hypothetical protein ACRCWQ_02710 [Bacilli bacterium]